MHAQRLLGHALVYLVAALLLGLAAAVQAKAQVSVPPPAPERGGDSDAPLERVIGEVTAANPAARQIVLKTDAGGTVTVMLQDETLYLRVPPGETDLKKAVKITPEEIGVGDRVYARGRLAGDQKSIPAVAIIVMTKAELTQKREREIAQWQKRGIAGTISALNPKTKEITLSVRSREGTTILTIEPSQSVVFRRYAPDSVRFGQAKPSSFAELNVGDSLRILGEKSSDGTRIKPEEVVSGSFRNIAGIVNAIDAAGGEMKITDLQGRKPLTVRITSDTMLRRMPPTKPATPATRPPGGSSSTSSGARPSEGPTQSGAPPAAATNRPPGGSSSTASGVRPSEGSTQGAAAAPATSRPPGGGSGTASGGTGGGGLTDPGRMPALKLGEFKREDVILVLCTVGAEPSRVTAIVVVAGVEALLGPALQDQTQIGAAWNFFEISVP